MNKEEIKKILNVECPVIFEIGCADGGDTQEFISVFPCGKFYCFEPEPKNIKLIKERIKYENFNLFEGAVSDVDGETFFHRSSTDNPDDLSYSGSIKSPKEHVIEWPHIKFNSDLRVPTTTLDFFCEMNEVNHIDFIWMDVQGAEYEAIRGAKKSLKFTRFFYTEYSNREYYLGQKNLTEISSMLGNEWQLLIDFGTDALFKNLVYDSNRAI